MVCTCAHGVFADGDAVVGCSSPARPRPAVSPNVRVFTFRIAAVVKSAAQAYGLIDLPDPARLAPFGAAANAVSELAADHGDPGQHFGPDLSADEMRSAVARGWAQIRETIVSRLRPGASDTMGCAA